MVLLIQPTAGTVVELKLRRKGGGRVYVARVLRQRLQELRNPFDGIRSGNINFAISKSLKQRPVSQRDTPGNEKVNVFLERPISQPVLGCMKELAPRAAKCSKPLNANQETVQEDKMQQAGQGHRERDHQEDLEMQPQTGSAWLYNAIIAPFPESATSQHTTLSTVGTPAEQQSVDIIPHLGDAEMMRQQQEEMMRQQQEMVRLLESKRSSVKVSADTL
jgi:hypothetical protein